MDFSIDKYRHIMLDMNGTFIFDYDRYKDHEDFGLTYSNLGYTSISPQEAHTYVRKAYDFLAVRYIDEAYYHHFPSIHEAILASSGFKLSQNVMKELISTFSFHELGNLPTSHKICLENLAKDRTLSVLSNLWSPKEPWLKQMQVWEIDSLFDHLFFSSDGKEMKPHSAFFNKALRNLPYKQEEILYIGDSFRCDVMGAANVGIDVVWLSGDKPIRKGPKNLVFTCKDLLEFEKSIK